MNYVIQSLKSFRVVQHFMTITQKQQKIILTKCSTQRMVFMNYSKIGCKLSTTPNLKVNFFQMCLKFFSRFFSGVLCQKLFSLITFNNEETKISNKIKITINKILQTKK